MKLARILVITSLGLLISKFGIGSVDPIFNSDQSIVSFKDYSCSECDYSATFTCKTSTCSSGPSINVGGVVVATFVKFVPDPNVNMFKCKAKTYHPPEPIPICRALLTVCGHRTYHYDNLCTGPSFTSADAGYQYGCQ